MPTVRMRTVTGAIQTNGHSPYINESTGTWWVFDDEAQMYVDTESVARGPQGIPGEETEEYIAHYNQVEADALQVASDKNAVSEMKSSASASASSAQTSASNANASAISAQQSATTARGYETNAGNYASNASVSAQSAKTSADSAKASESLIESYKVSAQTSASNAKTSETNASSSETKASNYSSSALASASSASASSSNASASASAASISEQNAKTSETNAKASETKIKGYADSAKASEDNANAYATQAIQAAQQIDTLRGQVNTNTSNISQIKEDLNDKADTSDVEHLHKEVSDIWRTIHDEHPNDMREIQRIVQDGEAQNVFSIGDQIEVPWVDTASNITYSMPFDVVAFRDVETEDGIVPGMIIQSHYTSPFGIQFSGNNAFYYAEIGLQAGTYYFTLGTTWGKCVKDKSYYFTISEDLEVGGQLLIVKADGSTITTSGFSDADPSTWRVAVYGSSSSVNCKEIVVLTEGTQGTSLGTLSSTTKWSDNLNIWNLQASSYGYNRWRDSAIRQFLNSNEVKGNWWTPKHRFDRRPDELMSKDGFLKGFNDDFLNVIKPIKVQTACNYVTDGGTSSTPIVDTTYDKFFLASLEEEYCVPQASGIEGEYYPYWKERLGIDSPQKSGSSSALPEHIRYALNAKTSAQNVRFRSAYRGNTCNAWYVYSTGYVNLTYSTYSIRFSPACAIC